jgi:C4-dicarboxylate-specific signal transduction histidine kinase
VSSLTVESEGLDRQQQPAWIDGDPVQIQIAIVNLLRNAAEALRDAAVPDPWISLSLRAEGEQWCLSVDDNGPGLPPALLDDTPLQTTKSSGSGLGLFVVRTTMENHHGALRCGTSVWGGAALQLLFPAKPGPGRLDQALPTTGD